MGSSSVCDSGVVQENPDGGHQTGRFGRSPSRLCTPVLACDMGYATTSHTGDADVPMGNVEACARKIWAPFKDPDLRGEAADVGSIVTLDATITATYWLSTALAADSSECGINGQHDIQASLDLLLHQFTTFVFAGAGGRWTCKYADVHGGARSWPCTHDCVRADRT
jgi:hypothetical protein